MVVVEHPRARHVPDPRSDSAARGMAIAGRQLITAALDAKVDSGLAL